MFKQCVHVVCILHAYLVQSECIVLLNIYRFSVYCNFASNFHSILFVIVVEGVICEPYVDIMCFSEVSEQFT